MKVKNFKCSKPFSSILLVVAILLVVVFSTGFASALEFDNVKSYNEDLKVVTITNAFGLGNVIGQAQLISNQNVEVARGYGEVARFNIWAYDDYNNAIKQFTFTDMKKKEKINRDFDLMKVTLENTTIQDYSYECNGVWDDEIFDYDIPCEKIKNGTHIETKEKYKKVTPADLIKNEMITIAIFTDVQKDDYVDWIPIIYGVEIPEWATWEESFNANLISYYKFDGDSFADSTGNHDATNQGSFNVSGKIIDGRGFDGSTDYITVADSADWDFGSGEMAFSWWQDSSDTSNGRAAISRDTTTAPYAPFMMGYMVSDTIVFYGSSGSSWDIANNQVIDPVVTRNVWTHYIVTRDAIGFKMYKNGISTNNYSNTVAFPSNSNPLSFGRSADTQWLKGSLDEIAIWERTITHAEALEIYDAQKDGFENGSYSSGVAPKVTLTSPINTSNLTSSSVDFIATVTDDLKVSNVTLYFDGVANGTDTSNVNGSYTFSRTVSEGIHNWSILAVDNQSIENQSETRTLNYTRPPILVTLTSPADTENLTSAKADFISSVTDSIGVENVSLYLDGILNETNTSGVNGSYTFSKVISEGAHNWSILAYNDGNHLNQSETRTLNYTQPPIYIDLNSPTDASTHETPTVNVSCNAYKAEGVTQLNLTINGVVNKTVSNSTVGQNLSIDGNINFAEGVYTWSCSALNLDTSATSSNRIFTVDYADTIFTLFTPENDTTINNYTIDFIFNASNVNGINNFSLYINDTFSESLTDFSATGNYTINKFLYEGNYTWFIQAVSNLGTITNSTKRTLEILYPTPFIKLITPLNDTNFLVNEITFLVNTSDVFGIGNVSLYIDEILTQTNTSGVNGNYTFIENLASGYHIWKVVVYSALGKINISETRNISTHTIAPTVYITAPTGSPGYYKLGDNETLSYSITEAGENLTTHLDSCWYVYGFDNTINHTSSYTDDWIDLSTGTSGTGTHYQDYTLYITTSSVNTNFPSSNMQVSPFYNYAPQCELLTYSNSSSSYIDGQFACANSSSGEYFLIRSSKEEISSAIAISYYVGNYTNNVFDLNCTGTTTDFTFIDERKTLTVYAKDEYGLVGSSTTVWDYYLTEISQTFSSSVVEGSASDITLNATLTNSSRITGAVLVYNGTEYLGTYTEIYTNNYLITTSFNVPSVDAITNASFYWNITFEDGTSVQTATQNQTITLILVDDCSTNGILLFTYTVVDEKTQTVLNGSSENVSTKIYLTFSNPNTDDEILNFTAGNNGTNNASICTNSSLSNSTFIMNALIEYTSGNRYTEFYNIQDFEFSNTTGFSNLTLYDLVEDEGEPFEIIYKGASFVPVTDLLIQVQRKYIDEGIYKTVELPNSGSDGATIAHLVPNDALYNFIFIKDGVVLDTFTDITAICQNPTISDCTINLNALISGDDLFAYIEEDDFFSSLSFNKTSKIVSALFGIISGISSPVVLNVTLMDNFGNNSVCTDSLNSAGGTLSCTVPDSFGNTTIYAVVTLDGDIRREGFLSLQDKPRERYAGVLIFSSIILLLFIFGIGVSENPAITGIFLIIGAILLVALNLVYSTSWVGSGATILWFIVAVVLIIVKGGNKR